MDGLLTSYLSASENPIADGYFSVKVISNYSDVNKDLAPNLEKIFGIGDRNYINEWASGYTSNASIRPWIELDLKRYDYVVRGVSLKYIHNFGTPTFSLTGRNNYSDEEKTFYISTLIDYEKLNSGKFIRIPIYNDIPFRYIRMSSVAMRSLDNSFYVSLLRYDIDDYINNRTEVCFFCKAILSLTLIALG